MLCILRQMCMLCAACMLYIIRLPCIACSRFMPSITRALCMLCMLERLTHLLEGVDKIGCFILRHTCHTIVLYKMQSHAQELGLGM